MSKRFELINFLNAHDNFKDNDNNKKLDSFDVVDLLNHYDNLRILLTEKDKQIAELQKQLEEKEKEIEDLRKIHSIKDDVSQCEVVNGVKFYTEQIMIVQILKYNYEMQINNLKQQLKSQPKEIVEKIKNICCIEDKCEDGSFVLGINEKDLDAILKEYDN